MSPLDVLANPETRLRTLRTYVNALDADLVKAKDILRQTKTISQVGRLTLWC